jgi:hypothetical protein
MNPARMGAELRRLLAEARLARLAACAVVVLAAVVWLGVAIVVLRVVFVVILLLAAVWCAWLVLAVWRGPEWSDASTPAFRRVSARARSVLAAFADGRPSGEEGARNFDEPQEAAVEAFRRSAEAVTVELLARYERLHTDAATLQRELADQIEIMRGLIDRMAQAELQVSHVAGDGERTSRKTTAVPTDELTSDPDLQAALAELDADLRLEKIEEREQLLGEREARLDRRERELAAFAAATQDRLS